MRIRHILPVVAALSAAPHALAQSVTRPEEEEIVVTTDRPRGGIQADAPPESTLSAADVRSIGATSIFQILATITPQTGSASIRGSGFPVILVNGRRITGPQEIRDLPPDVISRVDVFDEQVALQYGYSAEQRVVNLVLERRYSSGQIEAEGGVAAGGDRTQGRISGGIADINEGNRLAFNAAHDFASDITERERGILAPTSGVDQRSLRTVAPETQSTRGSVIFARALDELVTGSASGRVERSEQRSLLGLDSAGTLRVRESTTDALRATAALDGSVSGWQYTATLTGDQTKTETTTTGTTAPTRTESDEGLYELIGTLGGSLAQIPAGRVRANLRVGVEQRTIDSTSRIGATITTANLERTTPSARATLSVPVTNRRRDFGAAFGDISLNMTGSVTEPSDFTTLTSFGFGGSWAPTRTLRFTAQAERSDAAPSLQQLGNPVLTTPDVAFFDPVRGESVRVTRISGGSPNLSAEEREDLTINATWSPKKVEGLTLQASWARNNSTDVPTSLPTALPETYTAFPTRFVRDLGGVLTTVDTRPISLAARDVDSVRVGFSLSRPMGRRASPAGAAAGAGRPATRPAAGEAGAAPSPPPSVAAQAADAIASVTREGAGPPDGAAQAAAPAAARSGPPQGARPPGAGRQAASFGRWNVSVFYRSRLKDEVTLANGLAPIDVTNRGGIDASGATTDGLEFEGGFFYRGMGLRMNGSWTESFETPTVGGGRLNFSDRFSANARVFVNLAAMPHIVEKAPFLLKGARVSLSVDNLTDSFVEVRDQTGATPLAYQEGYQNPTGRTVQVSFRKQF